MAAFTITVQDQAVQALLQRMADRVKNMQPELKAIGDGIIERTHHRFETSTGPDGVKWKDHTDATLGIIAARIGGNKSYRKKSGALNAAGQRRLSLKKLLIDHGMNGGLMGEFHTQATDDQVTVSNPMPYAAMHQFGGTTSARSMIPGKTIQARPFLPVRQDGSLYPEERTLIVEAINDLLLDL